MRLATVRIDGETCAAHMEGDDVALRNARDLQEVLSRSPEEGVQETGRVLQRSTVEFAPPVSRPGKIVCVGLNYLSHLREIGIPRPRHPALFAKFASTLIGAEDPLVLPSVGTEPMWEVELAGKAFDRTTPVGPVLVTPEEIDHARDLELVCEVDGEIRQSGSTSELLFGPGQIIAFINAFASLDPGDLILTGTPAGSGPETGNFLRPGQLMRSWIAGIGECRNQIVAAA